MNYEDLKAGDTVYKKETVRIGWNTGKTFLIKTKVDRITKTQIVIGDDKFRRTNGQKLGEYWKLELEGVDQSKEMSEFKVKLKLVRKIRKQLSGKRISTEYSNETLTILENALNLTK